MEIDQELIEIFTEEALSLVAVLNKEAVEVANGAGLSYDIMRVFHTIGGISGLIGVNSLSELAYAAEKMVIPYVDQAHLTDQVIKAPTKEVTDMIAVVDKAITKAVKAVIDKKPLNDFSKFMSDMNAISASAVTEVMPEVEAPEVEDSSPKVTIEDALNDPIAAGTQDDIDPELLGVFYEECPGLIEDISIGISDFHQDGTNVDALRAINRALHTIKGGARMGGALKAGALFHMTESGMEEGIALGALSDKDFALARERIAKATLILKLNFAEFVGAQSTLSLDGIVYIARELNVDKSDKSVKSTISRKKVVTKFSGAAAKMLNAQNVGGSVRVNQSTLDSMLLVSGETSILRSRIENLVSGVTDNAPQLSVSLERLRLLMRDIELQGELMIRSGNDKPAEKVIKSAKSVKLNTVFNGEDETVPFTTSFLTEVDIGDAAPTTEYLTEFSDEVVAEVIEDNFDPLQMDRFTKLQEFMRMASEAINDIEVMYQSMNENIQESSILLGRHDIMASDLHNLLSGAQMISLDTLVGRFRKTVSQAARETGKQARLEFTGDGKMDRQALDKVAGAIDHLLRNCVAHGVEKPDDRSAKNKPEEGIVRLTTKMDGDEVLIEVVDDGGGINREYVKAKAVKMKFFKEDQVVSDETLVNIIFAPGFSTAETISTTAGRGVGLDSVKGDVESMGGFVKVSSEPGEGAKFTIRVRSTIATVPVLPMKVGDFWYAIPASSISKVVQVKPDEDKRHVTVDGQQYILASVSGTLVDLSEHKGDIRCVLIRDSNIAVFVENMSQGRELIMKKLGSQAQSLPGVMGASVMDDGNTALIVNPARIVSMASLRAAKETRKSSDTRKRIMVVDDSLTVRKASQRFLEREGFRVVVAIDGVDAMEKIEDFMPDLILSDIEMPRMDGFEFVKTVRETPKIETTPIIMISSRAIGTHIDRAFSLGANAYFGKPYKEPDLLAKMNELMGVITQQAA